MNKGGFYVFCGPGPNGSSEEIEGSYIVHEADRVREDNNRYYLRIEAFEFNEKKAG